jgi:hypothetical protein
MLFEREREREREKEGDGRREIERGSWDRDLEDWKWVVVWEWKS